MAARSAAGRARRWERGAGAGALGLAGSGSESELGPGLARLVWVGFCSGSVSGCRALGAGCCWVLLPGASARLGGLGAGALGWALARRRGYGKARGRGGRVCRVPQHAGPAGQSAAPASRAAPRASPAVAAADMADMADMADTAATAAARFAATTRRRLSAGRRPSAVCHGRPPFATAVRRGRPGDTRRNASAAARASSRTPRPAWPAGPGGSDTCLTDRRGNTVHVHVLAPPAMYISLPQMSSIRRAPRGRSAHIVAWPDDPTTRGPRPGPATRDPTTRRLRHDPPCRPGSPSRDPPSRRRRTGSPAVVRVRVADSPRS